MAAKKKALGSEAEALVRGTAAQAVGVATRTKPELVPAPVEDLKEKRLTTTFRIEKEMLFALQQEALRRYRERGAGGKADQSEVLRDILREWMKGGLR